jgi:hypothetical protein
MALLSNRTVVSEQHNISVSINMPPLQQALCSVWCALSAVRIVRPLVLPLEDNVNCVVYGTLLKRSLFPFCSSTWTEITQRLPTAWDSPRRGPYRVGHFKELRHTFKHF